MGIHHEDGADAGGAGIGRRSVLKGASAGGLALAAATMFASREVKAVANAELLEQKGVGIPRKDIRFGMSAFPGHNIYVIGIINGWFDEVGITLGPDKFGYRSLSPQVIPRFVSNEVDIHTWYGPLQIEIMERVPHVKLFTFSATYVGTAMLAAPNSGKKTVAELVAAGKTFDEAIKEVMAEMRGARVGIDNTGSSRVFLDAIQELGGVTFEEVELSVIEDARLVFLARGGNLDYAKPAGAAQNVVLLNDGWYRTVTVNDLIAGLPNGDFRGVGGVGHTGLATTDEYYMNEFDTILRMASVMFRCIDAIKQDLDNDTDDALKVMLPVFEAAAGAEVGVEGLKTIFRVIAPPLTFEQQESYWVDPTGPFYYWNVYATKIEAAKAGGLLVEDREHIPDEAFTGHHIYHTLLRYKNWYDLLLPKATGLSGDNQTLADQAAAFYAARNYLDAYRLLQAATTA